MKDILNMIGKLFFGQNRKNQLDSLDGIRGVGIFFVLFSHVANRNILILPEIKFAGSGSGQIGVFIFFVLSAFLLTLSSLKQDDKTINSYKTWLDYAFRRFIRIFPLYSIVLFSLLWATHNSISCCYVNFSITDVLNHLLLIDAKMHFWALAIIIKFYFIFPILLLSFSIILKRNIVAIIIFIITLSLLAQVYVIYFPQTKLSTIKYLPIFLGGSLFAAIHVWYEENTKKYHNKIWACLGFLCLIISLFLMPNTFRLITKLPYKFFDPLMMIYWGLLFGSLIFFSINNNSLLNKLLSFKPLRFIGIISFNIYLWHWFILESVARMSIEATSKIYIFYIFTFIVSILSFLLFEKPFFKLRILKLLSPRV